MYVFVLSVRVDDVDDDKYDDEQRDITSGISPSLLHHQDGIFRQMIFIYFLALLLFARMFAGFSFVISGHKNLIPIFF